MPPRPEARLPQPTSAAAPGWEREAQAADLNAPERLLQEYLNGELPAREMLQVVLFLQARNQDAWRVAWHRVAQQFGLPRPARSRNLELDFALFRRYATPEAAQQPAAEPPLPGAAAAPLARTLEGLDPALRLLALHRLGAGACSADLCQALLFSAHRRAAREPEAAQGLLAIATEALSLGRQTQQPSLATLSAAHAVQAEVEAVQGQILGVTGHHRLASEVLARAERLCTRRPRRREELPRSRNRMPPEVWPRVMVRRAEAELASGQLRTAVALLHQAADLLCQAGSFLEAGLAQRRQAQAWHWLGEPVTASTLAEPVFEWVDFRGDPALQRTLLRELAGYALDSNQISRADALAAQLERLPRGDLDKLHSRCLAGRLQHAAGNWTVAARSLRAAISGYLHLDQLEPAALAHLDLCQLHHDRHAAGELRHTVNDAIPLLVRLRVPQVLVERLPLLLQLGVEWSRQKVWRVLARQVERALSFPHAPWPETRPAPLRETEEG